jgi:hypothetical protein
MLGIRNNILKCTVLSVSGLNGGPVDPEPAKRVDMALKKTGRDSRFFYYSFVKCCGTETGTGTLGTVTF